MSQQDVARALEVIGADDDKRSKVAKGHLGSLEDLGLNFTKDEESLLHSAAKHFPHDGGYAYGHLARTLEAGEAQPQSGAVTGTLSPEFNAALQYAATGDLSVMNKIAD